MKTGKYIRLFVMLGAALFGGACILQMVAPTTQIVVVTATLEGANPDPLPQATDLLPSPTLEWTQTLTLTFTPSITASFTKTPVTMTAGQRLSCVKGPHYILYKWVAAIEEGDTVVLTARSTPEWPDYYYARKTDGTECWAFGASSTITGDASSLPVMEAPPLPTVNYTIANKTGLVVTSVKIRPMESSDWGANRLGAPIAPGNTSSLSLTAGFYDVLIQDGWGGALYEKYDSPIGSDPNYRTVDLDAKFEFYLQNNFAADVCVIKVKLAGGSWQVLNGPANNIAPGHRLTFKLLPGIYAVLVYRCVTVQLVDWPDRYFGPAVPGYNIP
jgi:hypothetical protein